MVGLLIYLFLLLKRYTRQVNEVFSYNKSLGIPISFEYSWLRGVKMQGQPLATENKEREKEIRSGCGENKEERISK